MPPLTDDRAEELRRGDALFGREGLPEWHLWELAQHDLTEGLVAIAETVRTARPRHELDLAIQVTDLWHRLDALLGELLVDVWWMLLALRESDDAVGRPRPERALSPIQDARLITARAAIGARARAGGWEGATPEVRQRLDELRRGLELLALGDDKRDPLAAVDGAPPSVHWAPSVTPPDRGTPGERTSCAAPHAPD